VTSGQPLYLVSACGSAEEFVAAFRRYADRTGLFIPSSAPLPAGRRGRLALTLKDGGVMIEGEAEILQSSAKPTVLHGRPGMTVKFVEPDEPSKTVLGELEKARLAMRPPPPTVPPRPASVPAEPRPVVPPTGGRIDAANALAECVVIGDPASLRDTASAPKPIGDPGSGGKPAPKFVVPSIPSVGARPKTPSTAPVPAPATPATEPAKPAEPAMPAVPVKPASAPASKLTSIGFPALDKLPAKAEWSAATPALDKLPAKAESGAATPALEKPAATTRDGKDDPSLSTQLGTKPANATAPSAGTPAPGGKPAPTVHEEATTVGEGAPKKPTATPPPTDPAPPVAAAPKADTTRQSGPHGKHKATSLGFPVMRGPAFETLPMGIVQAPGTASSEASEPAPPVLAKGPGKPPLPRGKNPTTPPLTPRHPTPVAPLPIVKPPARSAPVENEEERTDLSAIPRGHEATPLALAATIDQEAAYVGPPPQPETPVEQVDPLANTLTKPQRSGGMRASEIMAAIPTEDWTMSPDAETPTVLPADDKAPVPNEPPAAAMRPKGPPTGDWTIQLDPEAGWSEPAKVTSVTKVDKPPPAAAAAQPKSGNPVMAIASDKAFTAVEWEEKPTGIGQAKIEIDPTLMEPLKPMPALDEGEADEPRATPPAAHAEVIPPPLAPMPPMAPTAGSMPPGFPVPAGPSPVLSQLFAQSPPPAMGPVGSGLFAGAEAPLGAAVAPGAANRKRTIIVIGSAAFAVVAGFIIVLLVAGGGEKAKKATPAGSAAVKIGEPGSASGPGSAAVAMPGSGDDGSAEGSGSAEVAIVEPGSGAETPAVAIDAGVAEVEPPPQDGTCAVLISSVPAGADILLDKTKLGTTNGTFDLPCGAAVKLTLKKGRFLPTSKTFTPVAGKPNKLVVKLGKSTFSVKVTSTPAGATILVGGRSQGVTPGTIKLPAFESTSITLAKPGFEKDSKSVTPKANGTSHHVVLKKRKGR
jgi:hypothetical protein